MRDLDTSILQFAHALFLPFGFSTQYGPNPIEVFFFLTVALFRRSQKLNQPSDVRYCVKYLRYLRGQSLGTSRVTRIGIITSFVRALAAQVKLGSLNPMQDIEEMAILCHELLTSDVSEALVIDAIIALAEAVHDQPIALGRPPPDQAIECLREAIMRLPDLGNVTVVFVLSLSYRFLENRSLGDYEEAMSILDEMIASSSPNVEMASSFAGSLTALRWAFYGNPEYLEEAILRSRSFLNTISLDDPRRPGRLQSLARIEKIRFDEFGVTNRVQDADPKDPEVIDIPSFSRLAASLAESNAFKSQSPLTKTADRIEQINACISTCHITDAAGIEEALKYCRLFLASHQPVPNDLVSHFFAIASGDLLHRLFGHTRNPEHLNESIAVHCSILQIPGTQWSHFRLVRTLISSLSLRWWLLHQREDFDEIMQLFPLAVNNPYAKIPDRFEVSCQWANIARISKHTSVPIAYMKAISLMRDSLTFAPTLEIQHFRLVTMRGDYETLPLDYASYQVHMGQLEQAIETLERGRGLLWSEMRGLRTSIDQLGEVNSPLARKFTAVNQDLEALTTSIFPGIWMHSCEGDRSGEMDPLGHLVVKQRKLVEERDWLTMKIRALPGFETFLTTPSFDTLRSAAAHGPVIIINHCRWRSDIIILLRDSPPSLILTTDNFYDRAKGLKDQLFAARKGGLDSEGYADALASVLESLYDLVGRPVIQRLHELNVPEQSRVWWCPTSVFCSLPLHAMGPIRLDGPHRLYFSDLYIPSYTPTLSALIESRQPGSHTLEKPSILLVAQPDESMPRAWEEILFIRHLKTRVTTLISKNATPSAVVKGLQGHRFAHFSCHGTLEIGKPFDASFKLHEGERLTLLDIVRSRLPSAEFAFLSACHTAELTEESLADEGLHLSAAVQYSGFRSVVGTMWAMADVDGPDLTGEFYRLVFSNRWKGTTYYGRTAAALRDAVKYLRRRKKVTLERWVNFVHYGA